jgi:hypothetical protein
VTAFSYEFGFGTKKNLTLAHFTYAKASEAKKMQEVEEKMTDQQIAEARKMYDDWVDELTEQLNDISEGQIQSAKE